MFGPTQFIVKHYTQVLRCRPFPLSSKQALGHFSLSEISTPAFLSSWNHSNTCNYHHTICLVPKGVQEKRTEVLANKVDRMWVSNAFFEWTHVKSSTSEGRKQCCYSFLRNLTPIWPQLILQDVIHMSITKWTVVVLCYTYTEQHAMHGLLQ